MAEQTPIGALLLVAELSGDDPDYFGYKGDKEVVMTIRVTSLQRMKIKKICRRHGITYSHLVRVLIDNIEE